jgi:integrase
LIDITTKSIQNYKEYRMIRVSPYSAKRDLANLSSSFTWAITQKYLNSNPCKGIKKPKLPEKLPYFYSESDFEKLIDVIDSKDIKDLVIFTFNTALRQNEVITLEWSQIDFKNRLLILDNRNTLTKSKKIRNVPLNLNALQILTERELVKNSESVFTYKEEKIKQMFISHKFKKYVRKAGLDDKLKFHSLRDTAASWMIQRGASIYHVSKILGHSDLRVTQIYSHLRNEDLRSATDFLNP